MRSEIYVVNTTSGTTLASGATYAPSTIIRRYGNNCQMAGNGVTIQGSGYYAVDSTVTVTASAAGTVTASVYVNGNPVSGATSTMTAAAGDVVTLPLNCLVRLGCNCQESVVTVVVSGQSVTSNNLSLRVGKE